MDIAAIASTVLQLNSNALLHATFAVRHPVPSTVIRATPVNSGVQTTRGNPALHVQMDSINRNRHIGTPPASNNGTAHLANKAATLANLATFLAIHAQSTRFNRHNRTESHVAIHNQNVVQVKPRATGRSLTNSYAALVHRLRSNHLKHIEKPNVRLLTFQLVRTLPLIALVSLTARLGRVFATMMQACVRQVVHVLQATRREHRTVHAMPLLDTLVKGAKLAPLRT